MQGLLSQNISWLSLFQQSVMGGESRSKCQEIRGGGVWCRYHISRIVRLVWPSGPLSLLTVLIPLFSTTAHSRSFLFATSFWTFNLTNTHSTRVKYTRSGRIVSTKECLGRVSFVMLLNLKPSTSTLFSSSLLSKWLLTSRQ